MISLERMINLGICWLAKLLYAQVRWGKFSRTPEELITIENEGIVSMTSRMAKTVTDVCNELPFVNWDRFIDCNDNVMLFGWIDREEDSYKDFVCVEVSGRGYVSFTTSSAKYSETISNIYVSQGRLSSGTHKPCQRIEDSYQLTGIKNVVKIRDKLFGKKA
jgi:hypothetical protein